MTHAIPSQNGLLDPKDALAAPIHHTTYLVDGELREWQGDRADGVSPIMTMVDGVEVPVSLGSAPDR